MLPRVLRRRMARLAAALLLVTGLALPASPAVGGPAPAAPAKGGPAAPPPAAPGPSGPPGPALKPGPGTPAGSGRAVSVRQAAPTQVDPALTAQLAASAAPVSFLVKLRTQADLEAAVAEARLRAPASPAARRLAIRTAVVAALRDTALQSQAPVEAVLKQLQAKGAVKSFRSLWIVNGFAVTGTAEAVEVLSKLPEVERIDLDRQIRITPILEAAPAPQGIEWNVSRIGAPQVWEMGYDGSGVVVGSIDTGVDWDHPALASRFRGLRPDGSRDPVGSWFDAVSGAPVPYDDNGHGTHVTGTMVGRDGENIIGVAPGARWIAAKAFSGAGFALDSWILAAAQWILAPTDADGNPHPEWAPDVVNNSWGSGPGLDEWFRPVVQAWRAAGIVPVFSNGNSGPGAGTAGVPGNYPESFAVGATDSADRVASFSSRGPSPYGEIKPDVSAPGVGIRSSVPGGGYAAASGTSMAAPHVSGAVALILNVNRSLTVDTVEQLIMQTAVPRTDETYRTSPNNGYGYGLLNVLDAVSELTLGRGQLAGRVMRTGDDLDAPTIAHVPPTEAWMGMSLKIQAEVSDNVGVARMDLYVRTQGTTYYTRIPMQRVAGDHQAGTYEAEISGHLLMEPALEYYLEAMDGSGNFALFPSSGQPQRVPVRAGIVPGYTQDFESEPVGWTHGGVNDPWEWGIPTSGPGRAWSGERVYATDLDGPYPNNADAWLLMPPIDLRDHNTAWLSWRQWYDLETNWDFGAVWASIDGENWDLLTYFTGRSDDWQLQRVDLTPYAGHRIWVMFHLLTDGSVTRPGWYIDNVSLFGPESDPPGAPSGLTAEADALGAVILRWTAPADEDVRMYRIYRSATPGSGYQLIGSTAAPGTTFRDTTAPGGVTSYYVVTAVDIWGNEGPASNEAGATPAAITVIFQDDMESGPGAWTHGGTQDPWEHGEPRSGPWSAHSGTMVWATDLDGTYPNNTNAWLATPVLNLAGVTGAVLEFAHWYAIETGWDYGIVEIAPAGTGNWTRLATYSGYHTNWELQVIDLSAWAGQQVQIRFRLTTDGSVRYDGWYLDDVRVLGVQAPTQAGVFSGSTKPHAKGRELKAPLRLFPATSAGSAGQSAARVTPDAGIMAVPLSATVTILETGRSTATDPATGSYSLIHPAGTYTARAEAYGYYPAERTVTITDDATTIAHFVLQEMPRGDITGVVRDSRTGEPLPGVRLWVSEDPRIAPVESDAGGRFRLTVLAGEYTLNAARDGYHPVRVPVEVPGGGQAEVNLDLRPFVGEQNELAYDDGTAENAWAFDSSGNGWAVRFTPPEGATVLLRAARLLFWDLSWPEPGGTAFYVEVWDASGPDGSPGRRIGGPVAATARRDGTWTEVPLGHLGLTLTGDFYIAYIQAGDFPFVPGLATDETPPVSGRGWELVDGEWAPTALWEGDRMIRAVVDVEVPPPVITSPADGTYTVNPQITVSGTAVSGATVTVLRNGEPAGSTTAAGERFAIPITLADGENVLTATATVPGGTTDPSPAVRVYLDREAPSLLVTEPAGGFRTNRETVRVSGVALDNIALAGVTVNGSPVAVDSEGRFSQRIILNEGENRIAVVATDRAGNEARTEVTVYMRSTPPELTGIEPAADTVLYTGESVTIRFRSEPGLQATYSIVLQGHSTSSLGGTPMAEVEPGVYQGTYTAPAGTAFTGARILVQAEDAYGNIGEAFAPGHLTVVDNRRPTAVIHAPSQLRVKKNGQFDGRSSSDPDGRIVSWRWDMGDGTIKSGSKITHRYLHAGTYVVTLTVTDDRGATATAQVTVVVE